MSRSLSCLDITEDQQRRFENRTKRDPNSSCILSTCKTPTHRQYPRMVIGRGSNKRLEKCSRISYVLYKGPIPEDLFVLHSCDNPLCVNPDHLHLGTQADNMREASERERMHGNLGRYRYPLIPNESKKERRSRLVRDSKMKRRNVEV